MKAGSPDYTSIHAELSQALPGNFGVAFAAACALMAGADGWPAEEERAQLYERMRLLGAGGRLDIDAVVVAFERNLAGLMADSDRASVECLDLLGRLQWPIEPARVLAHACNAVAMADGGYDDAERDAALRICEAIGVSPEEIGVADAS